MGPLVHPTNRNRFTACPSVRPSISMGLWYWELMSRPDPAVLPVGTLHSLEWFWVTRRIFIYSHHNTYVFSLRCPSVRLERFPGICRGMHRGIGLKLYMLVYLYHVQNWLVYGRGLVIFQILALFWLFFKFGVSGHFLENAWREWPEILHADVSWPPSELISLWPQFADFSNFGAILT